MKSKLFIKKTRIPTYNSRLWIIVCPSITYAIDVVEDQIHTTIATKEMGAVKALAFSYTTDTQAKSFFLFLRPSSSPGEIAHECKHLVNHIFYYFGVRLSLTNDESEAYFLERIVDTAHLAIKQYKKLYVKPKKEQALVDRLLNSIHNN